MPPNELSHERTHLTLLSRCQAIPPTIRPRPATWLTMRMRPFADPISAAIGLATWCRCWDCKCSPSPWSGKSTAGPAIRLTSAWLAWCKSFPFLSLALLAGHVADRMDRKLVIIGALALSVAASLGLATVSYFELPILAMFACLFFIGVARAFLQPAKSSFLPQLVPREIFSNAVTWGLGGFQLASVVGPALGGWILAISGHAYVVYLVQAAAATSFIVLLFGVQRHYANVPHETATLKSLGEGIGFVWTNKVILGAMALDMFAVLLGGATALLPVFAKEVLHVGPVGYGWMASAPAIGALAMSLALMHRPPMAKAGQTLLWAVAGFGAAIIVFGLSRSFVLSLVALFMTGALDCISVVIRHTLGAGAHARSHARPRFGDQRHVHQRLERVGRVRVAARSPRLTSPVFAVVSGGYRHDRGRGARGVGDSRTAQLWPLVATEPSGG